MVELDTITDSECLHKLEADSTTGKVSVRIRIVQAFGVQNSYGRRKHIIRYMMIADDEINPFLFGISDFLYCFNSTIEYNNQSYTGFCGIVHSFLEMPYPSLYRSGM